MSELLNVAQVASTLQCSPETVVRRFAKLPGVVNLSEGKGTLRKRRYRVLRIPKAVVERYVGHPVTVPEVEKPKRKRGKKQDWMRRAARALAKAVLENAECPKAPEAFAQIALNARVYVFVPEGEWDRLTWFEPEFEYEEEGQV